MLLLKFFPLIHGLLLFRIKQHINLAISAVINANNAYRIAKTRKLSSNAANVTIRKIAKNVAATSNGLFKIFKIRDRYIKKCKIEINIIE